MVLAAVVTSATSGCSATVADRVVAVGSVNEYGEGVCTMTGDAVATSSPGYQGKGLRFTATAFGKARIDCTDDRFDTRLVVREVTKLEVVFRDAPTTIRVVGEFPTVCTVGRDADGREVSLGDMGDLELTWSDHVTRKPEAPDHGMGAAVFGTGEFGCRYKLVAAKPGTATITTTWNGLSALRRPLAKASASLRPVALVQPRRTDRRLALLPFEPGHFIAQRLVRLAKPMVLFAQRRQLLLQRRQLLLERRDKHDEILVCRWLRDLSMQILITDKVNCPPRLFEKLHFHRGPRNRGSSAPIGRVMTSALSIYADQPSRPVGQRPQLTVTRSPSAEPTTAAPPHLHIVRAAPAPAPQHTMAGDLPAEQEASLLTSLRATARGGETIHALYQRVEAEVGHQFAQLSVIQSRALHQRLVRAAAGDPLATAFHRMVADRKGRLLAFLADARRREAVGQARHR